MVDETKRTAKGDKRIQEELKESAQRIWLAGLGALSVAEEEGSKMFNSLVERGERWEKEGKERAEHGRERARSRVSETVDEVESRIDQRVTETMHRFGVPSRDEIRDLSRRVEELNAKIDALHQGRTAKPSATASPKTGAARPASPKPGGSKGATGKKKTGPGS